MESMNEQYGFENESVKSLSDEPIVYCKEGQELKCNGSIEDILHNQSSNPEESFQLIGETSKYQFILYKTFEEDSGYILMREKRRQQRLTLFREGKTFNCVYKDHLFQAWATGQIKSFSIEATDIKSNKTTSYSSWLSMSRLNGGLWLSNDEIKQISINRIGQLDVLVHRYASTRMIPSTEDRNNYEMDYHLIITRYRKGFKGTPIYPARQESDMDSVIGASKTVKPRSLNRVIKKVNDSAIRYTTGYRIIPDYSDCKVLLKYRCDNCGKNEEATEWLLGIRDSSFMQDYKAIADEFSRLGYPTTVRCYCKDCADKLFPVEKRKSRRMVFSVARSDCKETINSYPSDSGYHNRDYHIALYVLKGIDTVKGLAESTNTHEPADYYLKAVSRVLGGVIHLAEEYMPNQEPSNQQNDNTPDTTNDREKPIDSVKILKESVNEARSEFSENKGSTISVGNDDENYRRTNIFAKHDNKDHDETIKTKEKDPLQNQQETARLLTRLMQHCGCNFVKPSMADKIVSMVIILPLKYKNKFPFTNKYVLADAAILGMMYAISIKSIDYEDDEEFDAFVGECMEKIYRGIMEMYEVDKQSIVSISGNRIDYFQPIITDGINDDDMDRFFEETAMLFTQDIANNSFIHINEDLSFPLFDIDKQIQIEVETTAHFSTLFKMLENI